MGETELNYFCEIPLDGKEILKNKEIKEILT